ncbi:DUF2164 domain-containing protein [Rubrivirga marina]|uniref:DUF2164 domain-containing protein n=1 Tax=Rubrivirga marina TaxID=1196024 RepID=A0A271IZH6_9BACT|nr:DUF2164 domain-containing protein [Rubrivirga marina]PAP76477.1 hypothetical protein BSZ37_08505 [Rubrivirga marina]
MPVTLPDDAREHAVAALRHYAGDELGLDMGDLAAGFLLDFVLEEIGPSIHNQALRAAQRHLTARVVDLDIELGEPEFPTTTR